MSLDKIRELLVMMNDNELVEMELEEPDFKIRLKKPGSAMPAAPMPMAYAPAPVAAAAAAPAAKAVEEAGLVPIKSPIVGTFYRASSPDSDPFASEGTTVGKDTTVAIIEAMKIMNEIKAEVSGVIVKIMVENGDPVEYGQPLFMVRPA